MVTALLVYLLAFSFAYISLNAGAGALILFGAVQLTMFAVAIAEGERFSVPAWGGIALAAGGLIYLLMPGAAVPNMAGALLMVVAGIAWGTYSLLGRGTADPMAVTASNFLFCCPVVIAVSAVFVGDTTIDVLGTVLAILSGSLASGCGYAAWYTAVNGMTAGRAAVVQLSVPALVALASAMILFEPITTRLVMASMITLGGVALVLSQRTRGR
ncbi:MAG: DMT family transporter [Hyphomicrobiaceae bacterium]